MAYRSNPHYLLMPMAIPLELRVAEELFQAKWLSKHELDDGDKLYHYTTLGGMRGIIQERSLWYGHIDTFNDTLELRYGKSVVIEVLDQLSGVHERSELIKFLGDLRNYINEFGISLYHAFAVCFCKSGNLLSQWRGYAKKGDGYCLGFEFSSITKFSSDINNLDDGRLPYLRKVTYNREEQNDLVRSYLDRIMQSVESALDNGIPPEGENLDTYLHMMAMYAVNLLFDMIVTFKIDAFEEEQEWRLIRLTQENHEPQFLSFQDVESGLAPYRPTYLYNTAKKGEYRFPLSSVGFGPTLDPIQSRSSIELFLHSAAVNEHPIKLNPRAEIEGPGYRLR